MPAFAGMTEVGQVSGYLHGAILGAGGVDLKEGFVAQYFGILDGGDGVWGVRVPDLPGCHGGGGTAAEALEDAVSAAREWAEYRVAKGLALPAASPLEVILDGGVEAGEVIVSVPVLLDAGRPVRANLSLDAALLEDIDRAAKARGLTRSAFMASAAREKILAGAGMG